MAADPPVRRRRGRPPKRRVSDEEPTELDFEPSPDVEFLSDRGEDLGADLRRMSLETGSGVYAGRRSLF